MKIIVIYLLVLGLYSYNYYRYIAMMRLLIQEIHGSRPNYSF